ncbi:uncharacterized protein PHALS_09370 [Plasmopara halstedii]|uniref:Uncharacterized protein n=1 Tax=Plasmopara halstedii TaxID=4781 RepID=A0A0P1AFM3_PLAHL|nr:uncharacterized protein PHALS_09370 [Plasmopara halstedii]CEG39321.1 hypothetical protein PHALS_09370 [Plasmopara halstedii]|eukprot:XP_024575690.1 hypothetical protein PHALS_09370 [Plasmopara halstedii]
MTVAKTQTLQNADIQRRHRGWSESRNLNSSFRSMFDSVASVNSDTETIFSSPSDSELLDRARANYSSVDFGALSACPEQDGSWSCKEVTDQFVVLKRPSSAKANSVSHSWPRSLMCRSS